MRRIGLGLGLILLAGPAHAQAQPQPVCGSFEQVHDSLKFNYSETVHGVGQTNGGGSITELLLAPNGKTWSITVVLPNGVTCLMASGKDWIMKEVDNAPRGKDDAQSR